MAMLADPNEPWTSVRATPGEVPKTSWYDYNATARVLKLKDTRHDRYQNYIVEGACAQFMYEIPLSSFVVSLVESGNNCVALDTNADADTALPLRVVVYVSAHGRDHLLGEFRVVGTRRASGRMWVHLHRLRDQVHHEGVKRQCHRHPTEAVHAEDIARLLPGFDVKYEPECATNFDNPVVRGGEMQSWASQEYTVDFIAHDSSSRRVCIESKTTVHGYTKDAVAKCTILRDSSCTRVLLVHGTGEKLVWVDFGAPGTNAPPSEYPRAGGLGEQDLRRALGVF